MWQADIRESGGSMAKSPKQKLKLLYIIQILEQFTDENHVISTPEIIEKLGEHDILAERKSIYDDINQLIDFGYDIVQRKTKGSSGYYLASRQFELPELKLLVDAVQASKFITLKKSKELIHKLEQFSSKYEGKQLHRQVYVSNRIKATNERIYYNVDHIHRGIFDQVKILFRYFEWTVDKEMKFKKDGNMYEISPWALTFYEENYYLIGYDAVNKMMKHYRVDKMMDMQLTTEKREGQSLANQFDIAKYTNKTFGMFGGEEETVTIKCSNYLVGVIIDRFGKDISIRKRDEKQISIHVTVAVSGQFFGWITGLGADASIIGPAHVVEHYKQYLNNILEHCKENS